MHIQPRVALVGAASLVLACVALPTRAQVVQPEWLLALNLYRAAAGIAPVTEMADLSEGASLHARYIVEEDEVTIAQDPASPWYTPEGDAAAATGVQLAFPDPDTTDTGFIETWMSNAFTAPLLANPALVATGFGSHRDPDGTGTRSAGVLDVRRGVSGDASYQRFPVFWPGDGSTVSLTRSFGSPSPDPLSACPGFSGPTGLPLSLQLSSVPDVTSATLLRDGEPVEHCAIDADSYTNPDPVAQDKGRDLMRTGRFAVIVPKDELALGSTYSVSVVANGKTRTWSFSVGATTQPSPTTLTGTSGDDEMEGTSGDDLIYPLAGNDAVVGAAGADTAYGDLGRDSLRGNVGDDLLFGDLGDDRLSGGRGDDVLDGGAGDDLIKGRGGENTLIGGDGFDVCVSTSSKDTFDDSCEEQKRAH